MWKEIWWIVGGIAVVYLLSLFYALWSDRKDN